MRKLLLACLTFLLLNWLVLFWPGLVQAQINSGFNIHGLPKESEGFIECTLTWLANNCQTTLIRLWGYQNTFGINGFENLQKVLDAAPPNTKFIVALEDFPFGPPVSSPSSWYAQAAQPDSNYYQYVNDMLEKYGNHPNILAWELLNEPHCKGDHGQCFTNFLNFAEVISDLIREKTTAYISPGLMGAHFSWDEYFQISSLPNIDANSCHYNAKTNNPETCQQAGTVAQSAGIQFFYIGEAGYRGGSNNETNCTSSGCTNNCGLEPLQQRAGRIQADRDSLSGIADAFLVWQFSPPQNPLLICDEFSVFPGDPFCLGQEEFTCAPSGEGEEGKIVTISSPSHVCSDFKITETEEKQTYQPLKSSVLAANMLFSPDLRGSVSLEEVEFPDFEIFQKSMSAGLQKLLPYQLATNLSLPGDTTMHFRHFVLTKDESGEFTNSLECDRTPESEVTVPGKIWGKLAGAIRGLCGFLGVDICQPVANFQFQLAGETQGCEVTQSCQPGREVTPEKLPSPVNQKTEFSLPGWIEETITTAEATIEGILTLITTFTRTEEFQILSRSKLPGGTETVQNSKFLNSFLPAGVIEAVDPPDEAEAVSEDFQYNAGSKSGQYYSLRKMRNRYCMFLCGLYPQTKNISLIDPACSSCNPSDYGTPAQPRTPCRYPDGTPDWDRDPQECAPEYCRWNSAYHACDYGAYCQNNSGQLPKCEIYADQAKLEHGCQEGSQGPLCEGCVDTPYSLVLGKDQTWCGGGRNCQEGIRCKIIHQISWEEDTYDDPSYNGCYFANPSIKVRIDGLGGCAGLCNWGCPVEKE